FARNTMNSGYAINQMSFFDDKVHTMIGARLDKLRGDNYLDPTVHNTTPWVPGVSAPPAKQAGCPQVYMEPPSHVSPEAGVVYKPIKTVSFFATCSKSLVSPSGRVAWRPDGAQYLLAPGCGEGYCLGFRCATFGGKISRTLSAFQ